MISIQGPGTTVLANQPVSANFNTVPVNVAQLQHFSVQLVTTGAPSGNAFLECSTNISTSIAATGNWDAVSGGALISASGSYTFPIQNAPYPTFRVRWVNLGTSLVAPGSTSLMTITTFGKG